MKGKDIETHIEIEVLVGGFNPSEKYWSKWESSPNRGENKTYLKPPTSLLPIISIIVGVS